MQANPAISSLCVLCAQFLRDEMEEYYAALESSDDIWYNAADVQLSYSTASEGGGQFQLDLLPS